MPQRYDSPRINAHATAWTRLSELLHWLLIFGLIFALGMSLSVLIDTLLGIIMDFDLPHNLNLLTAFALGIFATAVVQSSTAISIATIYFVSAGTVETSVAVFIIFGINLGTTLSPLLLSNIFPGNIAAKKASLLHVLFNTCGLLIAIPLELSFQPFSQLAQALSPAIGSFSTHSFSAAPWLSVGKHSIMASIAIIMGCSFLAVLCIRLIATLSARIVAGTGFGILERAGNLGTSIGLAAGALVTILVGTSSTTVTAVTAMASRRCLSERVSLAVIIGANMGTTISGIFVSFSLSHTSPAALHVALVHVLFNVVIAFLVLLIPQLRFGLMRLADYCAHLMQRHFFLSNLVLFLVWFAIPAALFLT
ncbi:MULTISPECIES: hypothetical protein [unclassified Corynebacterium]|uniref:hypothetical protein n=1 Tax=unclassified Corynebacterium TaxID=2624378 RepID=UPI00163D4E8E|nr:hypothetical protein [Corynebacterium sp. SY003]